ncbi:MAG: TonB-dependent receptor, partial [Bacteroidia bacterium]|nr:TonB-dependent receptor [Bacteroidia bacterium]
MKDSSNLCVISRILLEDRWGGQTHWNKNFRGSDSIYGESIYTNRYESIIKLPLKIKKINLENNLSYNYHHQNSYYGKLFFDAHQHNLYYQSFFSHSFNILHSLSGLAFRYLYYKDNTAVFKNSSAFNVWIIPSVYTENTLSFNKHFQSILALRYDYHNVHKSIYTPRMMLLWTPLSLFTIRSGFTTGFRPVQLFTEDHAALTGARKIVIQNNLLPEKSYTAYYNIQSNILHKQYFQLSTDINMWYVYFS